MEALLVTGRLAFVGITIWGRVKRLRALDTYLTF